MQAEPFAGVTVPLAVEPVAADPVEMGQGGRRTLRRGFPGSRSGSVERSDACCRATFPEYRPDS